MLFDKREIRSTQRTTSRSKGESQQQTQPTYGIDASIWTRATLVKTSTLPSTRPVLPGSLCCPWVRISWPSGVITVEIHALGYSRTKQTELNYSKPLFTLEVNYVECMFCSYNFLDGRDKIRLCDHFYESSFRSTLMKIALRYSRLKEFE